MLYRSYFIFFPKEREQVWDYGYQSLAEYILANPDRKFVVDNGRSVPYIELLFFMKYQLKTSPIDSYYANLYFDGTAKFANVEVRSIDWKKDACVNQILVGDNLAISDGQVKDHFLKKIFEKKDFHNKILLKAYETNPKLKCIIETKVNR
jgi:hypothetical protein